MVSDKEAQRSCYYQRADNESWQISLAGGERRHGQRADGEPPDVAFGAGADPVDPPGVGEVVTDAVRKQRNKRHDREHRWAAPVCSDVPDQAGNSEQRNPYELDECAERGAALEAEARAVE